MAEVLDKYPGPFMNIPLKGPIATSTDPSKANQLAELQSKINQGYPAVEISALNAQIFQTIPKQIFEEIARSARINDIQLILHAPIQDIEIPGIIVDRSGRGMYSEDFRKESEFKLAHTLQVAAEIAKIYGQSIKVNVHAGDSPVFEWDKQWEQKVRGWIKQNWNEELRKKFSWLLGREVRSPDELPSWIFAKSAAVAVITDPQGKIASVERLEGSEYFDPTRGRRIRTVADEILFQNEYLWKGMLSELWETVWWVKHRDLQTIAEEAGKSLLNPHNIGLFYNAISSVDRKFQLIKRHLETAYGLLKQYGTEQHKKKLNEIKQKLRELQNVENKIKEIKQNIEQLKFSINHPVEEYQKTAKYIFDKLLTLNYYRIQLVEGVSNEIGKLSALYGPPKIVQPVTNIGVFKGSQTVVDSFVQTLNYIKQTNPDLYKNPERLKQILPSIVIENSYANTLGGRAEMLSQIVEETRKKLLEIIKTNFPDLYKKLGEDGLKKFVEEKVGATWDVGHIKQLIKYGYSKKDILKEVKKIKPYIKHVHVTENYGDYDTHLLPGMAWDEILKAQMEELRQKLLEKGVNVVMEIGGWYAGQFSQQYGGELPYVLEYSGFSPYANLNYAEAVLHPGYHLGYSPGMIPYGIVPNYIQPHVTQYHPLGTHVFSTLPPELGGQGQRQTFSGLPRE